MEIDRIIDRMLVLIREDSLSATGLTVNCKRLGFQYIPRQRAAVRHQGCSVQLAGSATKAWGKVEYVDSSDEAPGPRVQG